MLKIENISAGYGKKQVLCDVSLEVNKGDVVLLTGGNGSGKSTLLKCIYNLLPLWSGSIQYAGSSTKDLKPSDLIRKGIVYIPQKEFYFENLSVQENLEISGNVLSKRTLKERIDKVVEDTGLGKYRKRKPFNLSGGERKVLAFGMALIHKPQLLLFDEPFAGVDIANTNIITQLFFELVSSSDIAVIVVEHKADTNPIITRTIQLELGQIKNIKV